ncbi:hypothetical protein OGZ01_31795 (plasmid) [Vibrio harveyi]|nr:hypothetical protein [Vibrio harveyi]
MIKYIFNTSLRQEVIIDTDSNIDGYQYHYINVVEHIASGGEVQRFYQAVVVKKLVVLLTTTIVLLQTGF